MAAGYSARPVASSIMIMDSTDSTTNPLNSSAHSRSGGAQNATSKRFPDYILTGSLNLHKSAENAAALAKHIATQWKYLRINRNGIITSKQLEINRNPEAYGGLRNGKPLNTIMGNDT